MFSINLKQLRENAKISQKEMADTLGVTQQTISSWEKQRTTPDYESLVKIADLFNVSVDILLGRNTPVPPVEYGETISQIYTKRLPMGGIFPQITPLNFDNFDVYLLTLDRSECVGIATGSYLYVDPGQPLSDDTLVLLKYREDIYIGKLKKRKNSFVLYCDSNEFEPIIAKKEDIHYLGKVCFILNNIE